MFPADPTFTAKPVTVTDAGGTAGTVIGPLKETRTPDAPVRITLPNDCAEVPLFKKVNSPVARVPGIDPVEVTVFDCAGDVAVMMRAATSRLFGSGVPVTAKIAKVFETTLLSGVIVTVAVIAVPGII